MAAHICKYAFALFKYFNARGPRALGHSEHKCVILTKTGCIYNTRIGEDNTSSISTCSWYCQDQTALEVAPDDPFESTLGTLIVSKQSVPVRVPEKERDFSCHELMHESRPSTARRLACTSLLKSPSQH